MLSLADLATYQSLTKVMSDWSKKQTYLVLIVAENVEIISEYYKCTMVNKITYVIKNSL
jgi:hypothetical protein